MAKPKTKPTDRHKSGFMVRLPEAYRTLLQALQDKNQRSMTVEVQRALLLYAEREKVPAPAGVVIPGRSPKPG